MIYIGTITVYVTKVKQEIRKINQYIKIYKIPELNNLPFVLQNKTHAFT